MSELFQADEVRRALSTMLEPGAVFEVRALGAQLRSDRRTGTVSGYFDNFDACESELEKLTSAKGIYITLNPVNRALLARRANRLAYAEKNATTGDQHILRRWWLLIDVDFDRPSGISATDVEKEATHQRALKIYAYLKKRDWPRPVAADSGNGYHLEYRIDLACDDGGLIERVLYGLGDHFDGDGIKIDRTVFNPARIARLYGTLAAKGDHTLERPHRLSKILKAPEQLQVVSAEQLRALADELQPEKPATLEPQKARSMSAFDIDDFLARNGIEVAEKTTEPAGTIRWRLERCPFNPDHETPDAAVFQMPDGKLGFRCLHNSCTGKHWKDFRRLFEPDYDYGKAERQGGAASDEDSTQLTSLTSLGEADYPAPPDEAAYYGLAGDIVRRIEPHTEADRVALLVQILTAFGNVVGRNPHALADGARHAMNLSAVLVGETSKARKGTAWAHVRRLFKRADEQWAQDCIANGLSSGEGVIWAVRDPITRSVKNKSTGQYEDEISDAGITDKRLCVVEGEFANVLKVMTREGNTLSPVIRSAWDSGDFRSITKNSPARATGAHVSIIGHITRHELRRLLTETESANGFANRCLFLGVRRSKRLPEGGNIDSENLNDLVMRLHSAIEFAQAAGKVTRNDEARDLWARIYPELSEGKLGSLGAITARAEAQVLRLSVIYALLDCSNAVRVEHLKAALALWGYSERSAVWVFETGTGNKNADKILAALKAAGEKGLKRLQITNEVFARHATKFEIDEALRLLFSKKLADRKLEGTATRPAERWFYQAQRCEVCEQSTPGDGKTGDTSHYSHPPPSQNASSAESDTEAEKLTGDESGVARL